MVGRRRISDTRWKRARRERTAWCVGLVISAAAHVLAFALWPAAAVLLADLAGPVARTTLQRTAPLQVVQRVEAAREQPVTARPVVARPRPVAVARSVPPPNARLDLRPADRPEQRAVAVLSPRRTGARPPPSNPGDGYVRAVARSILPDWRAPRSLDGVVVTARVYVDVSGEPTGLVELVPPTPHRSVNREIVYRVRRLSYQPARRDGEPIPAWAEITFIFCRNGVTATSPAPSQLRDQPCPRPAEAEAKG